MKYIHPRRVLRILKKKSPKVSQILLERRVSLNYSRVLRRLRRKIKTEKLRVVFYTNEPQKWSYDSLYREFEKSPFFDPLVVVVPRWWVHKGKDHTRMSLKEQFDFYKERNYKVEYGYVDGEYLEIATFKPDIFFYLQLAEVPGIDDPLIVSKNAITCYCPYAFQLSNYNKEYLQSFHRLLFRYYVVSDITKERFESYNKRNSKNCVTVGYPKLDVYCEEKTLEPEKYWKSIEKFKIVYAPHHSFNDAFRFSTFPKTYQIVRELANFPETVWVFKPHPMLRQSILKSGLMNEEEMNDYYESWNDVGMIYDSGDYFDLFKTSDMMITDCGSFLAEYLPSHKPLVRLINEDSCRLDKLGEMLSECFYNVHNKDELFSIFNELVVRRNDYLREKRSSIANAILDKEKSSGYRVYKDLNELLRVDNSF